MKNAHQNPVPAGLLPPHRKLHPFVEQRRIMPGQPRAEHQADDLHLGEVDPGRRPTQRTGSGKKQCTREAPPCGRVNQEP
jgi:hypothetical protein